VQGQRVLFLENELLRVGVLLDKGADIFQFLHKPSDTEFMLHTPHGRRPPAVQSIASSWGSFLDYYQDGWQEILPNGGPACSCKGVEFGLHGEVSTASWDCQAAAYQGLTAVSGVSPAGDVTGGRADGPGG
jgi:hypothetical protein